MKKVLLFTALIGMLMMSCKKDEETPVVYDITFTVIEPAADEELMVGSELHMEVDIEGTKAIGNVELLVMNGAGDTVVNFQTSTTETFLNVHEHYDIVAGDVGDCHMQISAWESNYADRKTQEVHFHVM